MATARRLSRLLLLLLGVPRALLMQIFVQRHGARTALDVEPADLIDVVRAAVAALEGVHASEVGLSRWGEVFEDGHTLSDYSVQAGEALVYFRAVPPSAPPAPPPRPPPPARASLLAPLAADVTHIVQHEHSAPSERSQLCQHPHRQEHRISSPSTMSTG